ncbi:MAG: hypothetical protein HND52_00725 [Ignavibacteriae bacterium]|nr:hypothetical protein [Ignavibacteriota bacterium]NOG96471.1 hypothetical protein [Ignavibacteriota bacterium]
MTNDNNLNEILNEILLFDNEIEKLNIKIRSELLSKNKIDSQLYFKNLNEIIKEYESSLNNINNYPITNLSNNDIH